MPILRDLITRAIRRFAKRDATKSVELNNYLAKAQELWATGDIRAALAIYQEAEKEYPDKVDVLNGMGVCLGSLGNEQAANKLFERAYLLDDTHLPAVINRARVYVDARKSAEALPLLRHAWCQANEGGTNDFLYAIYASLCLNNGDIARATHFQLKARLSDFDSLRTANGYLFQSAYADIDERQLASEHVFWAETLKPLENVKPDVHEAPDKVEGRRIRIGYWSPDLRNHSVRYFLRPLLENHDREKFETYLYHDNFAQDDQTGLMRDAVDHFHDVYDLSDRALHDVIKSHKLDVLVELAGHTSANRLPVLKHRMATLQLTALGYPPTTGLADVDGKVLDRYSVTANASEYYSERPIVLPGSFWCFDPKEDIPVSVLPPSLEKGYITFGCIGNVAKINRRMLGCWKLILDRVPNSRFLIRSISFQDEASINWMKDQLVEFGIDLQRVDLLPPIGGRDLFKSYSEIDIILDTYPFNGGTTTCFATYMGVPVVSLYGQSLTSRMGLSILSNLGVSAWAVSTESEYVDVAVGLAQDQQALEKFRAEVRGRYENGPLGNGKLYARDFEEACVNCLNSKLSEATPYQHAVKPLPEVEVLRRAYRVLGAENIAAAKRILDYAKVHYGQTGAVRMLDANIQLAESGTEAAIESLELVLNELAGSDRCAGLIMLSHWLLQSGLVEEARKYMAELVPEQISDHFDQMQALIFHAAYISEKSVPSIGEVSVAPQSRRVKVVVPCDSVSRFEEMKLNLTINCHCPPGWRIEYQRCLENLRHRAYEEVLTEGGDIVIVMQRHIDVCNNDFFKQISDTLCVSDVVGVAGASVWNQLDWRYAEDVHKAGGFVMLTDRTDLAADIKYMGVDTARIVNHLAVVDGSVFALNMSKMQQINFDDELADAAWLMEEDWLYRQGRMGARLAVNRILGTVHYPRTPQNRSAAAASKLHWLDVNEKDPFVPVTQHPLLASALVKNFEIGCSVLKRLTK